MMSLRVKVKKILLMLVIITCLLIYLLYCPVPNGYTTESTRSLRIYLTRIKFVDYMANAAYWLGIGTSLPSNSRKITSFLKGHLGIPGTDPQVKEVDLAFNGVQVRVFEPAARPFDTIMPGFVYYHGGGWTLGDLDTSTGNARRLCKQINAVVVSVDYRLAPEHVFPAAFEDCVTATKYFITNAKQFHVNSSRIGIGGCTSTLQQQNDYND